MYIYIYIAIFYNVTGKPSAQEDAFLNDPPDDLDDDEASPPKTYHPFSIKRRVSSNGSGCLRRR